MRKETMKDFFANKKKKSKITFEKFISSVKNDKKVMVVKNV